MSSNYPGSLDNFSTSHADGVNETIHASTVNDLADAVNKIESTLGTNPVLTSNFSKIRKVTASTSATSTDYRILGDATSGLLTVTLPAASSNAGLELFVEKIDTSTNNVRLTPSGTDTIQGATGNYPLSKQAAAIRIVSDGVSDWKRIDIPGPLAHGSATSIFYVDGTFGNDSYPGTHPSLAKKTIGAAVTAASSGHALINIADGKYVETVDVSAHFGVTLRGSRPDAQSNAFGVRIQAPSATADCVVLGGISGSGTNNAAENIIAMGYDDGSGAGHGWTGRGFVIIGQGSIVRTCSVLNLSTLISGHTDPGSNGGTGFYIGSGEDMYLENLDCSNTRIAYQFTNDQGSGEGTGIDTAMKTCINFAGDHNWKFMAQDGGGGHVYMNWKSTNQLCQTSNGNVVENSGSAGDGNLWLGCSFSEGAGPFNWRIATSGDVLLGCGMAPQCTLQIDGDNVTLIGLRVQNNITINGNNCRMINCFAMGGGSPTLTLNGNNNVIQRASTITGTITIVDNGLGNVIDGMVQEAGAPNGNVAAPIGTRYVDTLTNNVYDKVTTDLDYWGWYQVTETAVTKLLGSNLESGTNTNTIATTDVGSPVKFDLVTQTPVYDNTHVAHGSLAAKFDCSQGTTAGPYIGWKARFGTQTNHYGRFYIYFTVAPPAELDIMKLLRASGSTQCGKITLGTGRLLKAYASSGSAILTSTALAASTLHRIEYHYVHDATNGGAEIKIFSGANADGGTADQTLTSLTGNATQADTNEIRFGALTHNATSWNIWMDDLVAAATAYPGTGPT